jgi:iron complex outermembrane receptor protein
MADKQGATDTRVLLTSTVTNIAPGTTVPPGNVGFLIAGGSPDLTSQKAHTWSYGADYTPGWVPGLLLSATYWHVSIYNLIAQAPYKTTQLFTIPAYSDYYILHPTLSQLQTATAGIVQAGFPGYAPYYDGTLATGVYALVDARRHNLGQIFDEGVDFGATYDWTDSWGNAEVGINGSTYTESNSQAYAGGPVTDRLASNTSLYNFSAHIGGTVGPVTGRLTWNYSAGYRSTTTGPQTHIDAFSPVNLFVSYDLSDVQEAFDGATIGVNINNLFDIDPPFANTGSGVANGSTFGRYVSVHLSKRF